MTYLLTADEMRACDRAAIEDGTPSLVLMERAARRALKLLLTRTDLFCADRVLVLCGDGNNGGDGLALARFLRERGIDARVLYCGALKGDVPDPERMTSEAVRELEAAVAAGVPVETELRLDGVTTVIDALFGIGLCRPIEGTAAARIDAIRASGVPVLALDIPSGVNADTGAIMGTALPARLTACFGQYKRGLFLYPGFELCGEIALCEIGIPNRFGAGTACASLDEADLKALLPPRPSRSNKGTFGRLGALCGSTGMCGAAILCGRAAYRAGVGLCEIVTPAANRPVLQTALPEAIVTDSDKEHVAAAVARAGAIVAGCGLGTAPASRDALENLLRNASGARRPLLLDADALNLLAADPSLWEIVPAGTIITPHLGEAARLCGKTIDEILSSPLTAARRIAEAHNVICLLKDAHTVIAAPDGRILINRTGCDALATAGSGDVLAGVIGALLASGVDPLAAAGIGAFLHGLAGERCAAKHGRHGTMAGDLPDEIGLVLRDLCE